MKDEKTVPSAVVTVVAAAALTAAVFGVIWTILGPPWASVVTRFEPAGTADRPTVFGGVPVVIVRSYAGEPFEDEPLTLALANEKLVFKDGRTFDCEPIHSRVRVWPTEPDEALLVEANGRTRANLYVGDNTLFLALSYVLVKMQGAGLEEVSIVLDAGDGQKALWRLPLYWRDDPAAAAAVYILPKGFSYRLPGGTPSPLNARMGFSYDREEITAALSEVAGAVDNQVLVLLPDRTVTFADVVPFYDVARSAGFSGVYLAYDPNDPYTASAYSAFGAELVSPELIFRTDGPFALK